MTNYQGFADLERAGWHSDGIASGYTDLFSPASDHAIPPLIESIPNDARVLDLCCGQGNVTEALLRADFQAVGADFSPNMLAIARKRVPEGEFVEADAQDLPFDDREFDAVVCSFGLMHVPDQPRALAQIRRVLKPGGRFAMTSWCGPDVSPTFQVFYSSVQEFGDPSVKIPDSPDFHQYADRAATEEILTAANFTVQRHKKVDCYWMLTTPDQLAEIFHHGAPRAGYLLTQQPEQARKAIKNAVTDKVRDRFKEGEKWKVPIPAALVVAIAK